MTSRAPKPPPEGAVKSPAPPAPPRKVEAPFLVNLLREPEPPPPGVIIATKKLERTAERFEDCVHRLERLWQKVELELHHAERCK